MAGRHGRPPMPAHVSRQRSAAGLFSGTCEAAAGGAAAAGSRPGSGQGDVAAAGSAALGTTDTQGSASAQLQTAEGAAEAKPSGALFARKTSSYIAEAADAAAAGMEAAGAEQGVQPPTQQQAERPGQQQLRQRHQQLRVSLPGSDAGLLSAEPSAVSEGPMDSPRHQEQPPGTMAPTPASAASSLAASPWPPGHQRRHPSVDMEGAAAYLQSPAGPQPPDGEAAGGRGAGLQHSSSSAELAAAGAADGMAGGEQQRRQRPSEAEGLVTHAQPQPSAQQHSQEQLPPPQQGAPPLPPPPEVVGEELPPTLLEVRPTTAPRLRGGERALHASKLPTCSLSEHCWRLQPRLLAPAFAGSSLPAAAVSRVEPKSRPLHTVPLLRRPPHGPKSC